MMTGNTTPFADYMNSLRSRHNVTSVQIEFDNAKSTTSFAPPMDSSSFLHQADGHADSSSSSCLLLLPSQQQEITLPPPPSHQVTPPPPPPPVVEQENETPRTKHKAARWAAIKKQTFNHRNLSKKSCYSKYHHGKGGDPHFITPLTGKSSLFINERNTTTTTSTTRKDRCLCQPPQRQESIRNLILDTEDDIVDDQSRQRTIHNLIDNVIHVIEN